MRLLRAQVMLFCFRAMQGCIIYMWTVRGMMEWWNTTWVGGKEVGKRQLLQTPHFIAAHAQGDWRRWWSRETGNEWVGIELWSLLWVRCGYRTHFCIGTCDSQDELFMFLFHFNAPVTVVRWDVEELKEWWTTTWVCANWGQMCRLGRCCCEIMCCTCTRFVRFSFFEWDEW